MDRKVARRFILGSAAIGSLGTFAMHAVLPALPDIRDHFSSSIGTTQLLVSLSMLAVGAGNLLVAPLSDRFGRRPVILAGLALFIVGSLSGVFAPAIGWLIAARIVQAFGSGAAMAVARATLVDFFGPERAVSGLAYTATAILVVPMIAPTVGGFAVELAGWRAVFALSTALGFGVLGFTLLRIQETHGSSAAARPALDSRASLLQLAASRSFRGYAFFGAAMFASASTFIAGAPHVAIDVLKVSPSSYGLYFILPAAASFTGFYVAARVSRRLGTARMITLGLRVAVVGGVLLFTAAATGLAQPLALFVPGMFICFANAIASPSATTSAIGVRPDIAGAASGLMGFLQLTAAALSVQLVAAFPDPSPYPLAIALLALNALALLLYRNARPA